MRKVFLAALVAACCLSVFAAARAGALGEPAAQRAGGAARSGSVTIANFQFAPKTITVKAGGTVTWTNKEGTHTVTADDGSWGSPTLGANQKFSQKFAKPGTYNYYCTFHGSKGGGDMSGVVRVVR